MNLTTAQCQANATAAFAAAKAIQAANPRPRATQLAAVRKAVQHWNLIATHWRRAAEFANSNDPITRASVNREIADAIHFEDLAISQHADIPGAPTEPVTQRGNDNDDQPPAGHAGDSAPQPREGLTARDVAERIGRSLSTIYRRIRAGLIAAVKDHRGRWVISLPAAA